MSARTIFPKLTERLKFIRSLVVTSPYYKTILILSLVSGVLSVFGLPLLIPVLDYMRAGTAGPADEMTLYIERALTTLGLKPHFYTMLGFASLLIISGELLVIFNSYIALKASFILIRDYSKRMFESYLKVNWLWLTSANSGEINYVVMREAEMAATCHLYAQRLVISFIQCLAYFGLALMLSVKSVLLAMVVYGALTVLNIRNANRIREATTTINTIFKKVASVMAGLQQNKKFLKTSLLNRSLVDRTISGIEGIKGGYERVGKRMQSQLGWNFSFMFGFLILLILFNDRLGLDYSSLIVLILVFHRLAPQVNNLSTAYSSLNNYLPMYESVRNRLDDLDANEEDNGTETFDGKSDIRFDHVHFSYPNGNQVINDLNVTVEAQKTIAIVGSSGAGKTTVLDLILGLLKPTSGTIYYGKVPHDRLDLNSLRSRIAYISQEPTLLDGTLKENLTIGAPQASEEMVRDICKKVHLDRVIETLPEGLETNVGENGIKLSGGQRQRVILGRALFLNPKILILDEATSELDSETEKMVQETIKDLSKELTIIIVAHRLSTVKPADKIYVLENGTVCESGTYEQLLEKKGRFHALDSLQRS